MENIGTIVRNARPFEAREKWQSALVEKTLATASRFSKETRNSLGTCLAAGFDLIVGSHYYGEVAHKGWLYCRSPKPFLFYPYTNTCPRCALSGQFHFQKAHKPQSGVIGTITSQYLGMVYEWYFRNILRRPIKVLRGEEPIDLIIADPQNKRCLIAEIKAAPLVTLPLAADTEALTEDEEGKAILTESHQDVTLPDLSSMRISLFLMKSKRITLFPLGGKKSPADKKWAAEAIISLLDDPCFFKTLYGAWSDAFSRYSGDNPREGSYWLTNSCGQPSPRPSNWPQRSSGGGYESVSDFKTSVGMDRTDDIKKGTYQVLKLGADIKYVNRDGWKATIGLISNIHAVQHYEEYLTSIQDVIWTKDKKNQVSLAGDLNPKTRMHSLFDGIVSLTSSYLRDEWLAGLFTKL